MNTKLYLEINAACGPCTSTLDTRAVVVQDADTADCSCLPDESGVVGTVIITPRERLMLWSAKKVAAVWNQLYDDHTATTELPAPYPTPYGTSDIEETRIARCHWEITSTDIYYVVTRAFVEESLMFSVLIDLHDTPFDDVLRTVRAVVVDIRADGAGHVDLLTPHSNLQTEGWLTSSGMQRVLQRLTEAYCLGRGTLSPRSTMSDLARQVLAEAIRPFRNIQDSIFGA